MEAAILPVQLRNVRNWRRPRIQRSLKWATLTFWTANQSPSLAWEWAPSMRRRLLEGETLPVPSGYTGSKSMEIMKVEASAHARSGKSSTNVTSETSLEGHSCVRETVSTGWDYWYQEDYSRHLGALGPRRGCCPHDVKDMSEGVLATMNKDTELEEGCIRRRLSAGTGSNDGMEVLRGRCTWRWCAGGGSGGSDWERRDGPRYAGRLDSNVTGGLRSGGLTVPTGHLCRIWNGQWCTVVTASHRCLSVLQRSTSHSLCILIVHTGTLLSPLDGWLTSHGLWYKRVEAPFRWIWKLQRLHLCFHDYETWSFFYLSTDGWCSTVCGANASLTLLRTRGNSLQSKCKMTMEITAKSEIPVCNQWHASQCNIRFRVWCADVQCTIRKFLSFFLACCEAPSGLWRTSNRWCPGTGQGLKGTMASVPLWASTALQSAVSLWH